MQKIKFKYPVEVFWSEEDKGYIATVPDLQGCSAWGVSEGEAIKEVHNAAAAWIKAAEKAGRSVPIPLRSEYSGKFLMRIPKRLHAELALAARMQGVSLNQYVLYLITGKYAEYHKKLLRKR